MEEQKIQSNERIMELEEIKKQLEEANGVNVKRIEEITAEKELEI